MALFGAGSALMHHSAGAHIYAAGHIFVVHISCTSLPQRQPFCNDLKKIAGKILWSTMGIFFFGCSSVGSFA